jgi:hypothetical protein
MPTPVSEKIAEMTFGEAMTAVARGDKVTRLEWENPSVYLYLDTWLLIMKEDGKGYTLKVTDGDMLALDWVIVSP